MGLLTILKKMKQKERELRLLMLYPPSARAVARVVGPAGWAEPGAGARPPWVPIAGGASRTRRSHCSARGGGGGGPYHSAGREVPCKSQPGGLKARLRRGIPVSRRGVMQWW